MISISGRTWKAEKQGDFVVFTCKICGYQVRSHVKNYEIAYISILTHIAETHAKPD